jgi:hypothetical protein
MLSVIMLIVVAPPIEWSTVGPFIHAGKNLKNFLRANTLAYFCPTVSDEEKKFKSFPPARPHREGSQY